MSKVNKNQERYMLKHFKSEWVRDDIFIVLPEGYKHSKEWDSINNTNIKVLEAKKHPESVEWTLLVHDVFKFGVVKNQHGYHVQQLQHKP